MVFSVAKLLLKLGAKLTLNDKKDLSNDDRTAELGKLGVRVISGYHPVEIFDEEKFDYLVKNPGIPYEKSNGREGREVRYSSYYRT